MCFLSLSSSPTGQNSLFLSLSISKEPYCPFIRFFLMDRTISTSLKFDHGRVLHELRVQLKLPKTRTRWLTTVINFVSKPNVNIPRLMVRSCRLNLPLNSRGTTSTSCVIVSWVCSFRNLRMSARSRRLDLALEVSGWTFPLTIRHTGKVTRSPGGRSLQLLLTKCGLHVTPPPPVILHLAGEALRVTLRVNNLSSRILRPRFVLCSKLTVDVQTSLLKEPRKILRDRCSLVKPYRTETLTKAFNIPDDLTPSNLNRSLIKLEYCLKVNWGKTWNDYLLF